MPPPGWYQPKLDFVKPSQPAISFSKIDRFKEERITTQNLNSQTEVDLKSKFDIELWKKIYDSQIHANARKSADDREKIDHHDNNIG